MREKLDLYYDILRVCLSKPLTRYQIAKSMKTHYNTIRGKIKDLVLLGMLIEIKTSAKNKYIATHKGKLYVETFKYLQEVIKS